MTVNYQDAGLKPVYIVEAYPYNPETQAVEVVRLSSQYVRDDYEYITALEQVKLKRSAWNHDMSQLLGGVIKTDNGTITAGASQLARKSPTDPYDRWTKWSWAERKVQVFILAEGEPRREGDIWFEAKMVGMPALRNDKITITFTDRLGDLTDILQYKRYEGNADPGTASVSGPAALQGVLMPVLFGLVTGIVPVTVDINFQLHMISDRRMVNEWLEVWDGKNELDSAGEIDDDEDLGDNIPNGKYKTYSPYSVVALGAPSDKTLTVRARGGEYIIGQTPTVVLDPQPQHDPPSGGRVGSELYCGTAPEIVAAILEFYGEPRSDNGQRIARDETSWQALNAELTNECGLYVSEKEVTRLNAISQLLSPFGYWAYFSDGGYMHFARLRNPVGPAEYTWKATDIFEDPVLIKIDDPWFEVEVEFDRSRRFESNLPVVQGAEVEPRVKTTRILSDYAEAELAITITSPLQGDAFISGQNITFSATAEWNGQDVTASMDWTIGDIEVPGNGFIQAASLFGPGSVNVKASMEFDQVQGGISIGNRIHYGTAQLNITVDGGVADPPAPKILKEEYLGRTIPKIHSLCADLAGAQNIAAYWLELHKVPRQTITVITKWNGYQVRIGADVHLTHPRLGLESGRFFVVLGVEYDSKSSRAIFTLWG